MSPNSRSFSLSFFVMGILFCVCLITSNLLETKMIQIGPFSLTGGLLVFPISYIINDCIAEVWGFRKARFIIWLGFLMNFFVVTMGYIAIALPAASYWQGAEHFAFIFGMAPRIAAASFIAFLIGSFLNAWVMSRMKIYSQGKHFSLRAVVSTFIGETGDSLLFFPIAFTGIIPFEEMLKLMGLQIIAKTLYEILVLPLTIVLIRRIKQHENTDVYDHQVNYNFLRITDI